VIDIEVEIDSMATKNNNSNVLCIIPARGGSKGIPKKNIKSLGGFPVIAYSIEAALESKVASRVVVSTDNLEIADYAIRFGAECPFLRPSEFASNNSRDIDYVKHAIEWFAQNESQVPGFIAILRPTTPLRDTFVIDEAIKLLMSKPSASSLRSSHKASETPFKWFLQKNSFYEPLTDKLTIADTDRPRQSFDDVYIPNGYVDVIRTSVVLEQNSVYGDNILLFETTRVLEIDTLEDFELIENMLKLKKYRIFEQLQKKYQNINKRHVAKFRHTGIVVLCMDKMLEFYTSRLGFEISQDWVEESGYLDKLLGVENQKVRMVKLSDRLGEVKLELLDFIDSNKSMVKSNTYSLGYTHMALQIDDIDEFYNREKENLEFISEPLLSTEGFAKVCYCRDIEGNLLEIVEMLIL